MIRSQTEPNVDESDSGSRVEHVYDLIVLEFYEHTNQTCRFT